MRVVIDTNVLLAALPKSSRFRPIVSALSEGTIELVVSTPILLEYQEILTRKTNTLLPIISWNSSRNSLLLLE
nr:PIN domain-containing protein [Spirosoma terrae]